MAYDAKYGRVTVEHEPGNPFGADEPVFLIRGRDKTAPDVILDWATRAERRGAPSETVQSARHRAAEVADWQDEHPELVKVPD